ncbi:hypothetical protein AB0N09_28250 [Streptomyces erythrochromogenes]|uniref:hypothetical protein n=1 Tax=Streptomyces erythrochromogenes TaxID=285574 RepID=UPI003435FDB6
MDTAKSYPEHGAGLWLGRTTAGPLPLRRRARGWYWAAGGRHLHNLRITVRDLFRRTMHRPDR